MQGRQGKTLRTTVLFVATILIALSFLVFSVQPASAASAASNRVSASKNPTPSCAVREIHLNGSHPATTKCLKYQAVPSKSGVSYCAVREIHLNGSHPATTKCLKYEKYQVGASKQTPPGIHLDPGCYHSGVNLELTGTDGNGGGYDLCVEGTGVYYGLGNYAVYHLYYEQGFNNTSGWILYYYPPYNPPGNKSPYCCNKTYSYNYYDDLKVTQVTIY